MNFQYLVQNSFLTPTNWLIPKVCLMLILAPICLLNAAQAKEKTYQINASAFMLANIIDETPRYAHLEVSRKLTDNSYLGLEFLTWRYSAPVGIPYGPHFDNPEEEFPGSVRDIGIGITYQKFHGEHIFTKFHAVPFYQSYFDSDNQLIQNGFQLFLTARMGYRWTWKNETFFIEPSVAVTTWPINTNLPEDFKTVEDKWPSYFLFEPGLNIGFRF